MSDQLTTFERALLGQFEALAKGSEASLQASKNTSEQLQSMSKLLTSKITKLERRIAELEQREATVINALNAQAELTEAWQKNSASLVQQVNALLAERRK